jgi:hypothetical protein
MLGTGGGGPIWATAAAVKRQANKANNMEDRMVTLRNKICSGDPIDQRNSDGHTRAANTLLLAGRLHQ